MSYYLVYKIINNKTINDINTNFSDYLNRVSSKFDFIKSAHLQKKANYINNIQKMVKKQNVDMPFKETLGERIAEMTKMLQEINQLAVALDIAVKDGPKSNGKG